MLTHDRVEVLSFGGPVTVVRQSNVPTAHRLRALGTHRALAVILGLSNRGDRDSNRSALCEIHRIVTGDVGFAYQRARTSDITDRVLAAVASRYLLVLDG